MSDPDIPDADRVRNKRLAKLQQSRPSPQPGQGSEQVDKGDSSLGQTPPETSPSQPVPSPSPTNIKTLHPSLTPDNMSPPPLKTPNGDGNRIRIRPAGSTDPALPHKITSSSSSGTEESLDQLFEDRTLRAMLRLSLDQEKTQDAHGSRLIFLPGLLQELQDEGQPVRLTVSFLEQAIIEAGSNMGQKPLHWLVGCWRRLSHLSRDRSFKVKVPENKRWAMVQEARRLCMSWSIFAITTPELFGLDYDGSSELADRLLAEPDDPRGFDHEFLGELAARLPDDDALRDAFIRAIESHSQKLASLTMDGIGYRSYTAAMRNLVRYKPFAMAITQSSTFADENIPAAELEVKTLLGPYFQLSPLQAQVTNQYFPNPKTIDPAHSRSAQSSLRLSLQTHQNELLDIINPILKASTQTRDMLLDWFALVVNLNHKRRAISVDKRTISSDGFMINVTTCLDQLCGPFMDATFSKIDKVQIQYLQRRPRVIMKDETKINSDQETSDSFYDRVIDDEKSNFISEVFFLTVAAHHYGTGAAHSMLKELERNLKYMQKQLDQLETDRHKYVNNPVQLRMFDQTLDKYKKQLDNGLSYKLACQGIFLDELSQNRSMQFMRYLTVWILRLVSPTRRFPAEKLVVPLPQNTPDAFKCLPEYFLEVISDNFQFILSQMPYIISSTQSDELVMLCITFLRSSDYIKNPYLKAGLITLLYQGSQPYRQGGEGVLASLYNSMTFAHEHLLHALMQFFIEAEFMGGHGQFFDKFQVRFEIFQIIKCVWSNAVYQDNLYKEAKLNSEFFVRFVNLLLNDVTFVLDESFSSFLQIYDLQKELSTNSASLDDAQREEKEEALSAAQGKAKSYMSLTNETVAMLKLFTSALSVSFTMPEIVQRLADMLDYNLDAMVGPKSRNLKVDNIEQYNFNPKSLLAEIVDVYLNLGTKSNFILAVARDGRSYKPANFDKARDILSHHSLKSEEDLRRWNALHRKIAVAKAEDEAAEHDLGEIPEEFLDPLMFTLMDDPVILPTSRNVLDRSTIRSHLLSDPNDPFNRVPLKIEDVKPATEIKAQIEAFKYERIGGRKKEFVEATLQTTSADKTGAGTGTTTTEGDAGDAGDSAKMDESEG